MPSKPSKRAPPLQALARPGEGVAVGMVRESVSSSGVVTYRLDFRGTQVPDRRFAADAVRVDVGQDMVRVIFGQFLLTGPKLEHVVILRVPFIGARQFVRSMQVGGMYERARAHLQQYGAAGSPNANWDDLPKQTFTLDANILIAGFTGREACLDLYHTSPHVIMALIEGGEEYRAEPVARVILTTRLLLDIYEQLEQQRDAIPTDHIDTQEEGGL